MFQDAPAPFQGNYARPGSRLLSYMYIQRGKLNPLSYVYSHSLAIAPPVRFVPTIQVLRTKINDGNQQPRTNNCLERSRAEQRPGLAMHGGIRVFAISMKKRVITGYIHICMFRPTHVMTSVS